MNQTESGRPPLDLTTLFLSISSAAYMGMQEEKKDLALAGQNIDLLELLKEKTRGNRNPDEDRLIESLLFELRLKFVEISQKKQTS